MATCLTWSIDSISFRVYHDWTMKTQPDLWQVTLRHRHFGFDILPIYHKYAYISRSSGGGLISSPRSILCPVISCRLGWYAPSDARRLCAILTRTIIATKPSNNKYECTIDQELTYAAAQVAALFCIKWRHGHHLETVMSNRKSVNRCVFVRRTFLANFILIQS